MLWSHCKNKTFISDTLSTMTMERNASPSIYSVMEAIGAAGKPEGMKYPYARYPYASSRYPSSHRFLSFPSSFPSSYPSSYPSRILNPFRPAYPSMKSPRASAYPYSLPISALPYPSPFPTHFMDSRPIPSDMAHLANKLYSAPYLFALGSGHHFKLSKALMSASSTMEMARRIALPSPANPCYSQKATAINASKNCIHFVLSVKGCRSLPVRMSKLVIYIAYFMQKGRGLRYSYLFRQILT